MDAMPPAPMIASTLACMVGTISLASMDPTTREMADGVDVYGRAALVDGERHLLAGDHQGPLEPAPAPRVVEQREVVVVAEDEEVVSVPPVPADDVLGGVIAVGLGGVRLDIALEPLELRQIPPPYLGLGGVISGRERLFCRCSSPETSKSPYATLVATAMVLPTDVFDDLVGQFSKIGVRILCSGSVAAECAICNRSG